MRHVQDTCGPTRSRKRQARRFEFALMVTRTWRPSLVFQRQPLPNPPTHIRTHARTHAHAHAHTHTRTHTSTHAHTHPDTHTQTHTSTHTNAHTHIHTNTHTNTTYFTMTASAPVPTQGTGTYTFYEKNRSRQHQAEDPARRKAHGGEEHPARRQSSPAGALWKAPVAPCVVVIAVVVVEVWQQQW